MKFLLFIFIFFFITNCSKQKTVLICGDHVCINKSEAEQYFEENLHLEVKIIDKKLKKETNLVQLNLAENPNGKKIVKIYSKKKTDQNLKILSDKDVVRIKENIKSKKKEKKKVNKNIKKNIITKKNKIKKKTLTNKTDSSKNEITQNNVYNNRKDIVDVCTIIKKCSIDEISNYLLKQGNKNKFPDITVRQ